MDAFVSRKRRRVSLPKSMRSNEDARDDSESESTDLKLAILSSLHPDLEQSALLETLILSNGSVEEALASLSTPPTLSISGRTKASVADIQSSLSFSKSLDGPKHPSRSVANVTRKGQTLYLYSPDDIARHTPCSIIHNFLPPAEAEKLLRELLVEARTYSKQTFKVFDNVVQSPHTMCFYVSSLSEAEAQRKDYIYNGAAIDDIRQLTPEMRMVSAKVQEAVNREIEHRIKNFYPEGKKLRYQSPRDWKPNAAFVNCYDGGGESVGYHSDQLTYLGPRAVIGRTSSYPFSILD